MPRSCSAAICWPEQVDAQPGVHRADLGRVVGVAVVALGEDVDAVDVRVGHRRGEGCGVEVDCHVGDVARRVEVEVDLAEPVLGPARAHAVADSSSTTLQRPIEPKPSCHSGRTCSGFTPSNAVK
jgi:hypothetical protein